ncbi:MULTISPECIES: ArnT family glycosyltransferase [Rhizobium]|uniref:ArnT family glycosyltransferase n=1 Tax=Rhizobium TaxID=379 RepID=UPI000522FB85|nr:MULTISPECIES: hypothetical protein [Rhizobium]KPN22894.1 hypothetical protein KS05_31220 [Rhizobium brockwellii]MDV4155343.1 hypothetical protein [Rhizobium brockwellii]QJX09623.1 hypothetical protein RLCC275e_32030 [Rhizobium brockwellii]TAX23624.1 hypothetical protein ELI05_32635 [Rhizobium leguminosarum]TAX85620.1 hypothetical protein ELH97_32455 [Rhizobium leguminosarum]
MIAGWWAVSFIILWGLVIDRGIVVWLNRGCDRPFRDGIDFLFSGILPALAISGGAATVLGAVHGLGWEIVLPIVAVSMIWRRRDLVAVLCDLGSLFRKVAAEAKTGNPFPVLAVLTCIVLCYVWSILALFPSSVDDVWVFHIPLANSIIEHAGFVSPQIDHPFYGNIPLFFNLLFALVIMVSGHWTGAATMNIAIFFGFLFLLSSCASRWRACGFFLVVALILTSPFFTGNIGEPMTDLARSCFSVAAMLFLWRYFETGRPAELFHCALVLGGAVGGKYTELQMLGLVGLVLIPTLLKGRISLPLFISCLCAFLAVASYWYAKNLIILGNPIYPFLFGHPGLTDEWMIDYMLELGRAFDPANRHFVTNLASMQGWHDFLYVLYDWFLARKPNAILALGLILAGLAAAFRRIAFLAMVVAAMFVIWYAAMFNHIRWATPAYLLFFSTGFIGASLVRERMDSWLDRRIMPQIVPIAKIVSSRACLVASPVVVALLASGLWIFHWYRVGSGADMDPAEMKPFDVVLGMISVDEYLESHRKAYFMYRYIADHDLRTVFQPFHNSNTLLSTAYNDGRDGGWQLPRYVLPAPGSDIDVFIRDNHIGYFIVTPDAGSAFLAERLGEDKMVMAHSVVAHMMPRSSVILTDRFGWKLYRFDADRAP